ncbi:SCO family protein [Gelidibacter salicanalis]|uniref:SCO family protein n=1 Tax=Gelidibacter salicanalis TaxID=291193 RepID=A0A934NJA0_9FLAO|nr:SCO family protein [Gelidibacter salicanalis]MBJ7882223.1 SCO family protein [Gelidibacter salicanalis]
MSKKTNYSYVGISFIVLLFGIYFVPKIIDRVNNKDVVRDESRTEDINLNPKKKPGNLSDLEFMELNGVRKKVPAFSFTNQNGETITNKDYEGKVYVLEFFFTTCPTICPKMNANMLELQNTFSDENDFGIASFSIAPSIDTPEVLKTYADEHGVTNPNWNMMTGNQADIYKLANDGFYLYTAEDDSVEGGFEHSGNFALIDKNGFIRSRADTSGSPIIYYNGMISEEEKTDKEGMEQQITMLKEDIAKLLKE